MKNLPKDSQTLAINEKDLPPNLPHGRFGQTPPNEFQWRIQVTDVDANTAAADIKNLDNRLLMDGKDGKPFHLNSEAVEDVILLVSFEAS